MTVNLCLRNWKSTDASRVSDRWETEKNLDRASEWVSIQLNDALIGVTMIINVGPDLEAALNGAAQQQGRSPEDIALNALRERFIGRRLPFQPQDEWERLLLSEATDC